MMKLRVDRNVAEDRTKMNAKFRMLAFLGFVMSLITAGCGPERITPEIVFENVNVIPMTSETVLENYAVVVKNGEIKAVGKFEDLHYGREAQIVDAGGKYLLPGFSDMHVHLTDPQDRLWFLAAGITLVRNMWGKPEHLADVVRWEAENLPHPEVYTTGPLIDGRPAAWVGSLIIEDPAEVAGSIEQMKADGYDAVKVYDNLSLPVYDEIVRQAARYDLPVVGHVPFTVGLEHVIQSGQLSIEHLRGYTLTNDSVDAALVRLTIESGVWNCPTIVAAPEKASILRILYENGVRRFVSGTDTGIAYIHPGSSLHEEFKRLHEAGFTPYEVLLATTRNAAEMLGYEERLGTVEVGKDADLVLLDENPLEDIANTSSVAGVVVKGVWFSEAELQETLETEFQSDGEG
jgi:imidazolonepropionase-like amidohydrolase